jgi:hypothetical protein
MEIYQGEKIVDKIAQLFHPEDEKGCEEEKDPLDLNICGKPVQTTSMI